MSKTVTEIVKAVAEDGLDVTFGTTDAAIDNGWYDWFCQDRSLKNRSKKFMTILNRLTNGGKVSLDGEVTFLNKYAEHLFDVMILESTEGTIFVENDTQEHGARWAVKVNGNHPTEGFLKFDSVHSLTAWLNEPWA